MSFDQSLLSAVVSPNAAHCHSNAHCSFSRRTFCETSPLCHSRCISSFAAPRSARWSFRRESACYDVRQAGVNRGYLRPIDGDSQISASSSRVQTSDLGLTCSLTQSFHPSSDSLNAFSTIAAALPTSPASCFASLAPFAKLSRKPSSRKTAHRSSASS